MSGGRSLAVGAAVLKICIFAGLQMGETDMESTQLRNCSRSGVKW